MQNGVFVGDEYHIRARNKISNRLIQFFLRFVFLQYKVCFCLCEFVEGEWVVVFVDILICEL